MEDLLEARRPQLARVKVPHWSPARKYSILGWFPPSVLILSEVIFRQAQMSATFVVTVLLLVCSKVSAKREREKKSTVYINEV